MTRSVLDTIATIALQRGREGPAAIHELLARTERWSGAELERNQLIRAAALVQHAATTAPFYAAFPRRADIPRTLEEFRTLPLLRREDVRERASELLSTKPPRGYRIVREANSSGSTGKHVTVQVDAVSDAVCTALSLRDAAWHARDPREKCAAIRAVVKGADAPDGKAIERWLAIPESGPGRLLNIHTPMKDQLAWLARERPAYVVTYPSNAVALLERAEREGIRWPELRELATFGEVFPDGLRELCGRVWGVPVVDAYSSVEMGFIALQCPLGGRYHVQSEHVLVEILRQDGTPCGEGESGRVVVTALHSFAMPLVRYDIEDFATLGGPCPCGRGLPVLTRIVGRARNVIRLPSGDRVWPRFGSNDLGGVFPVRQFRLRQRSLTELVLELVPDRPFTEVDEARLREYVLGIVKYPFELSFSYLNEIPRSAGGKFEDVICEI